MQENADSKNEKYIQQELQYVNNDVLNALRLKIETNEMFPPHLREKYQNEFRLILEHVERGRGEVAKLNFEISRRLRNKIQLELIRLSIATKPKTLASIKDKAPYEVFLKFWALFPFILPPQTRKEAYEPAYNDLMGDFLKKASRLDNNPATVIWLKICFGCQTFYMLFECLRVWSGSKFRKLIWDSFVESMRKMSGG